jgi:hypothetical protein
MQASKIKVKSIYAIKGKDGLRRFKVTSITQVRKDDTGSPHDYTSTVQGYVIEDHQEGVSPTILNIKPESVLGPFDEHQELVKRKAEEDAKIEAEKEEKRERSRELARKFFELCGVEVPRNLYDNGNQYFHADKYGYSVRIDDDGVRLLLRALTKAA